MAEEVQGRQLKETISELRTFQDELKKLEEAGRLNDASESPGLIGEYITKLRLRCSLLFSFENRIIDHINVALVGEPEDKNKPLAERGAEGLREHTYRKAIEAGKSPSAAEAHAREMTRLMFAEIKVLENKKQQIRNEYERFNGIVMSLQSRLNEFNTERRMG